MFNFLRVTEILSSTKNLFKMYLVIAFINFAYVFFSKFCTFLGTAKTFPLLTTFAFVMWIHHMWIIAKTTCAVKAHNQKFYAWI